MASSVIFRSNTSPLKRSFDYSSASPDSALYYGKNEETKQNAERRSVSVSPTPTDYPLYRPPKRRTPSITSVSSMLSQSPTIMSGSFPSFMSVYGSEENNIYNHALLEQDTKTQQLTISQISVNSDDPTLNHPSQLLERRNSVTSATSSSAESSPTTTSSTFDSPLMADQSPDLSPESATSLASPKSFQQPRMVSSGTQTMEFPGPRRDSLPLRQASTQQDQIIDESKRNLKKLTIDMKLPSLIRPVLGSDSESLPFSAPTSPLKEPLKTGRRKPTNLTIRTPGFNQLSFGNNALAIPPTPAQKPILHQAQSSPSLPSLASPGFGPVGGMQLALPNIAQNLSRDLHNGSIGSALATNLPALREEPYQPPQSQEAPERGYTDGPCLIYDAGVYLYLEPTDEEASKFDTVINVAKEIKNPFETTTTENNTVMSVWRNNGNRQSVVEPQTAVSEISFKSAFEWPSSNDATTPTTPKPTSTSFTKRPEYLHIKWDHNSEILNDLYPLCRLIDDRVHEGKKVLVHCQLGVSRSASLIIAYGLYKGYESDFHSMYMTVKKRSQWVGPNMSLIYQLTDFKTRVDRGEYAGSTKQPKPEWFIYGTENARTPTAAPPANRESRLTTHAELLEPTRPALRLNKELPPVPAFPKNDSNPRTSNVTENLSRFSIHRRPTIEANGQPKTIKKAIPRALPFRQMGYSSEQMTIPPHRPRVVPGLTFAQPSMDLAMQDVPAAPSLFSPRATEFVAAPFGVTTAGDLVTSTPKTVQPPPGAFPGGTEWRNSLFVNQELQTIAVPVVKPKLPAFDPRSPHQIGEAREIMRNIDGFL